MAQIKPNFYYHWLYELDDLSRKYEDGTALFKLDKEVIKQDCMRIITLECVIGMYNAYLQNNN